MVPDAATAISIAVAVWNPIYGEKQIASEKPYNAILKGGLWTVTGSVPGGWVGGVATAVISKQDGRIIKVYHTK
nr:NTF2 fold immunity protein [Pseudoduganella violacea]